MCTYQSMASLAIHLTLGFFILCLVFNGNVSEYKQWQPNTNWNNPTNWAAGKLPCSRQDVQLLSPIVVALSGQASLRSLSLPMNGELVMNTDAELIFHENEKQTDQCPEGDVSFTATDSKNWYNPANWKQVDIDGNPVVHQSNGLLHLNQVPCQHDQVQFEKGSSFLVKSDQQITIASVIMNGQVYTQKSFQDYLDSDAGKIQLKMSKASIKLTGDTCIDPKGCYCNTLQVKERICSFVKCEETKCKLPLTPSGSCCSFCGAIIKVKPLSSFSIDKLKSDVLGLSDKFLQRRVSQVQYSISRTADNLVQIVFADFGDGKKAQDFAEKVIDNLSESPELKIKEKLQSSGAIESGSGKDQSSSQGLAIGIGVGVAVLLIAVVVVVAVWLRRKRTQNRNESQEASSGYEHVEMQPNSGSMDQLNETVVNDSEQHKTLESDNALYESTNAHQTFDNPMYESTSELKEYQI